MIILMMICGRAPLTSHFRVDIDHIKLLFFQIRVENLKRVHPVFSFLFVLTSSGLRTNHSARFWVRGVHPVVHRLFWFAAETPNHIQLKTGWTPLSFFSPNLEKHHPYMVNLCSKVWCQRESTGISHLIMYSMYFE